MPSRFTSKQIWRHNGAIGQARFIRNSAEAISLLYTVTPRGQSLACEIVRVASQLMAELKERDE